MNEKRLQKLTALMDKFGLSGVALNPGPTLNYLTGLDFHLMERPTVLLVTRAGSSVMVLPALEKGKLPDDSPAFHAFTYGDDPALWPTAFQQAAEHLNLLKGDVGIEPTRLRFLELQYLKDSLPKINFVDGGQVTGALRVKKDAAEIEKMQQAADIAQEAMRRTLPSLREGVTEKATANELIVQLLRAGSDPHMPFSPIVAFGENSANPHAVPTDRALQPGDLVLIDWGAGFEGYFSDITRTFTFGQVDSELKDIGNIVLEANQAARKAGTPGVDAGAIDRAARSVIEGAGYGKAFIHRTGHGLGMEAHEAPYIFAGNDLILAPGMTFTIEPGIYLPGKGGVRIEDDVVMTENGLVSLTDMSREVLPVENFKN